MISKNTTHYIPPPVSHPPAPHPSITPPVVADKGLPFAQKIANLLSEATPGPIVDKIFKKSKEVPPKLLKKTDDSQCPEKTNQFDTTPTNNDEIKASVAEAQSIKSPSPPRINFSKVQAGDVIFKVATPRSENIYQKIRGTQTSHVENFCNSPHKLPVPARDIVHCDISIGNGQIARVGGPHSYMEWIALGSATPSKVLPISELESASEHYIVMRSKNEKVAQRMAKKAKETAERPVTYDLVGVMKTGLLHDRGEEKVHLLKEGEQGPQVGPLKIPDSMICSEFAANIILDGEREAIREKRGATIESITNTKIVPSELIDKLVGSGRYEMFMLDQ